MKRHQAAVVTGGGTGIGRAISHWLAQRGIAVAIIYSRSVEAASETAAEIEMNGGRASAIRADVSNQDDVNAMVAQVVEQFGQVDYLVNNAAITYHVPMNDLDSVTDEMWDRLLAVNVKGAFRCARALAPYLQESSYGAIVNIGSIAGIMGKGSSLPYAVSKAAVHSLTQSLAYALAPDIRVNCVAPGFVETRWWEGHLDTVQRFAKGTLLQRQVEADDIAEVVGGLLTQKGVTGQLVVVDGGGFV